MLKAKAYFSHPIRGKHGEQATEQERTQNCQKAIVAAKIIEIVIPGLDMYVPAYCQEFDFQCWTHRRMTEDEILATDCDVLANKDLLIVYDWQNYLGNGMVEEINFAKQHNIKTYFFSEICQRTFDDIKDIVNELLHENLNGQQGD